jgi:hypothetical protein
MLPNVGYDPVKDFVPVGMIAASPHIISDQTTSFRQDAGRVHRAQQRASPANTPSRSGGAGMPAHLGPELLASMAGIKLTHVPYKGTGPAIADLLGGHVSMTYSSLPPALGLVREGKVRPIAIASVKRSALLPDVPTASETLGRLRVDAALRHHRAGHTPREIVMRLNAGAERGTHLRRREVAHRRGRRRHRAELAGRIRRRYCGGCGEMGRRHQATGIEGRNNSYLICSCFVASSRDAAALAPLPGRPPPVADRARRSRAAPRGCCISSASRR